MLSHKKPYLEPWVRGNKKGLIACATRRYMQIFPCSRQKSINIKMRVCWGKVLYDFFWKEIRCMLSCNFSTLAILDACVCNMSATRANAWKTFALWDKCDLAWYRLVLTAFHHHVSSLDYLIQQFSQRSPLFYIIVAYLRIFLFFNTSWSGLLLWLFVLFQIFLFYKIVLVNLYFQPT